MLYTLNTFTGWNSCLGNNGKCSNLCLALPDAVNETERHKCSCPTHYTLDDNNRTCSPPESFILFSQKTEISRLIVDEDNSDTAPDVVLPIQNLRNLKAIDYDEKNGHVYWISGKSKSIKRSKIDGSGVRTTLYFFHNTQFNTYQISNVCRFNTEFIE